MQTLAHMMVTATIAFNRKREFHYRMTQIVEENSPKKNQAFKILHVVYHSVFCHNFHYQCQMKSIEINIEIK